MDGAALSSGSVKRELGPIWLVGNYFLFPVCPILFTYFDFLHLHFWYSLHVDILRGHVCSILKSLRHHHLDPLSKAETAKLNRIRWLSGPK